MPPRSGLAEAIRERAGALGFALVGIARPGPSGHTGFFRSWLREGYHGEMAYLERPEGIARRREPSRTLRTVRSVVVVGDEYHQEDPEGIPGDPSRGVIAKYARGRDYHRIVGGRLRKLHRWIESEVGKAVEGRVAVDTGPVLEREMGERAGLGWFGKNTMLINPRRGSYFFLGVLLLDLDLPPDEPFAEDHCGSCSRCLEACPTGALLGRDASGAPVMDARRCISYLTIERRGAIPLELRPLIGNRIYGCDICQDVCPWNERFARPAPEPGYAARGPGEAPAGVQPEGSATRGPAAVRGSPPAPPEHPGTRAPGLVDLMRMTEADWEGFSRGSAIGRAGYAGFKRNVAVALGNWFGKVEEPDRTAVRLLAEALEHPEPLVRAHSAWALGRAASPEARDALRRRRGREADSAIREEIQMALGE